jgi:hypothetical protein
MKAQPMNKDTALSVDHVDAYIQSAQRELAKARQHADGTREQAMHLEDARLALNNACTVIARVQPPR